MKIGLFSVGLDTYGPQFDGLLENLNGYHAEIRDRIAGMGAELVDGGRSRSVVEQSKALAKRYRRISRLLEEEEIA